MLLLIKKISLYIRTVRYLTFRQVFFQLIRKFRYSGYKWDSSIACKFIHPIVRVKPLRRWQVDSHAEWISHAYCFISRHAIIRNESNGKVNWEYLGEGGLWLDNLHYMRYWDELPSMLTIDDELNLLHWLRDWVGHVARTPDSKALTPPYNASERAYSLGRFLLCHNSLTNKELDYLIKLVIVRDLNYVASQLEFHLGGNHLLKNLMSLAWGTCLFEGDDAKRWQKILDKELHKELNRQILADGFHCERSPMYHNMVLLDLLDIINVAKDGPARDSLMTLANAMIGATMLASHTDGEMAFFNDCALDSCPRSAEIIKYGQSLCGSVGRPDFLSIAGLYALEVGGVMHIITKAGPLGSDEQMGHAHSDLFSFEMSVKGQMLFVNSGTSTYYDQPFRDNERACAAHNTVTIPGYVQCQHWSYFRVASRARPSNVRFELSAENEATLSGMVELLGANPRPKLMRKFEVKSGCLIITDAVTAFCSGISSHFHLHPNVRIITIDELQRRLVFQVQDGQKISFNYSAGLLTIEDCLISRRFNTREASKKLIISDWSLCDTSASLKVEIQILCEDIN